MRYMIVVIILLCIASVSYATVYQEVVYLKDGSIIRGLIIEQIPNESIKVKMQDGSVFVFTFDEIEKITKEVIPKSISDDGYYGIVNTAFLTGEDEGVFSISVVNGGMLGNLYALGIGVGWDFYPNGSVMPIFLDQRVCFIDSPITPFLFVDAGYGLGKVSGSNKWDAGGFVLKAGLGIKIHFFNIEASYQLQKSKIVYDFGWFEIDYNFFRIAAGFWL